jgi:hypothetical protein
MKKTNFLENQPGQNQVDRSQQQTIQQNHKQQQQYEQQLSFWSFEAEFLQGDVCHGAEIQNRMNPDVRDFIPGNKSSSAT